MFYLSSPCPCLYPHPVSIPTLSLPALCRFSRMTAVLGNRTVSSDASRSATASYTSSSDSTVAHLSTYADALSSYNYNYVKNKTAVQCTSCVVLCCVVLCCVGFCCIVLYCIELYCIVLCCILSYCIVSKILSMRVFVQFKSSLVHSFYHPISSLSSSTSLYLSLPHCRVCRSFLSGL